MFIDMTGMCTCDKHWFLWPYSDRHCFQETHPKWHLSIHIVDVLRNKSASYLNSNVEKLPGNLTRTSIVLLIFTIDQYNLPIWNTIQWIIIVPYRIGCVLFRCREKKEEEDVRVRSILFFALVFKNHNIVKIFSSN